MPDETTQMQDVPEPKSTNPATSRGMPPAKMPTRVTVSAEYDGVRVVVEGCYSTRPQLNAMVRGVKESLGMEPPSAQPDPSPPEHLDPTPDPTPVQPGPADSPTPA